LGKIAVESVKNLELKDLFMVAVHGLARVWRERKPLKERTKNINPNLEVVGKGAEVTVIRDGGWVKKYLTGNEGLWEVDESLRSILHFTSCDLLGGATSMGDCDLIICPDELIYFSNGVKRGILEDFAQLLDPSGILIVGANEPVVPFCDRFELVNHESGTFYRQLPDA